jgi:putative hydrolase of the HAD superfamily
MQQPKVIFLDAVGTLFGVRGSVGEIYGRLAGQAGVEVESELLNQAFIKSFQAAPKPVFPGIPAAEISQHEFTWWQAIAAQSFERVGALQKFANFSSFFTELYTYFATTEPWFIYADVLQALENWQAQGIELGVLSNFDSRLYTVLEVLDLARFFTSVTISTEVGFAKPEAQIFAAGLQKHPHAAQVAWHIGDSFVEDYQGAKAAGLGAIWLRRTSDESAVAPQKSAVTPANPPDSVSTLLALLPPSPSQG